MKVSLRIAFLVIFSFALASLNDLSAKTEASGGEGKKAYDPVETIMHHISDANEFEILHGVAIPLPVILYAPDQGWTVGLSSMFDHGKKAVDGYVMHHGRIMRVQGDFPKGTVEIGDAHGHDDHHAESSHDSHAGHDHAGHGHDAHADHGHKEEKAEEEAEAAPMLSYNGKSFALDKASAADGGLLGRGITSFYDFSITKNVFALLLAALILFIIFYFVSKGYKKRGENAPKGIQGFIEPIFIFIRDEVAKPMIGEKHYERFLPFVMTLFFFILVCNLLGLIPIFPGSANVTGNLAVTMGLAIMVFLVTNLSGKKDYWQHTFAMPGVPWYVLLILTPVEILGLVIKPFSLMIRLFANITAGHIIILSLIGLVFVFGNSGENVAGASVGAIVGGAFTAFMNLIELLVAFLQAFIFSMLGASYIGAAVEEHDHHHDDHHAEVAH